MGKVYGYARSNRGKEGIEFQTNQIEKYAKNYKLDIEMYSDSSSGVQVGSHLQKLINVITNDSKLVVVSRTRLSRHSEDLMLIINELKSKNIELIVLNSRK